MNALLRAEFQKIWTGKLWWVLLVIAIPWCAYISYSFGSVELDKPGPVDAEAVTATVARQWFQIHLFTSILAAVAVTREYGSRTIARSVVLGGGRSRVFAAKVVVATTVSILYSALAVVLGIASAWISLPMLDVDPVWSHGMTMTVLGVFAAGALAAPWGAFLGWIFRNQVVTIIVLLLLTLMVEPLLLKVDADKFNWTFSTSLQAIYRDTTSGLLDVPVAFAAAGGWIVLAGVLGYIAVRRLDVP